MDACTFFCFGFHVCRSFKVSVFWKHYSVNHFFVLITMYKYILELKLYIVFAVDWGTVLSAVGLYQNTVKSDKLYAT